MHYLADYTVNTYTRWILYELSSK